MAQIKLKTPSIRIMRQMKEGDIAVFSCTGSQPNEQTIASSIAGRIGGVFRYATKAIVDTNRETIQKALFVTCHIAANEAQKRGRKKRELNAVHLGEDGLPD